MSQGSGGDASRRTRKAQPSGSRPGNLLAGATMPIITGVSLVWAIIATYQSVYVSSAGGGHPPNYQIVTVPERSPRPSPPAADKDLRGALQHMLEGTVDAAWDAVARRQAEKVTAIRKNAQEAITQQQNVAEAATAQVARAEAVAQEARSFASSDGASPLQLALSQTPLTPWELQQVESLSSIQLSLAFHAKSSAALPRRQRAQELGLLDTAVPPPSLANEPVSEASAWRKSPPRGAVVLVATYIDRLSPFPRTWLGRAAGLLSWRHAPGVRCLVATESEQVATAVRTLGCEVAMGAVKTNGLGSGLVRELLKVAAATAPDAPYIAVALPELLLGAGLADSLLAFGDGQEDGSTPSPSQGASLPVATLRHVQAQGPEGGFDRVLASGGLGLPLPTLLRLGGVAPDSPVVAPEREPYMHEGLRLKKPIEGRAGVVADAELAGLAAGLPAGPAPSGGNKEGSWKQTAGSKARARLDALNDAIEGVAARGGLAPATRQAFVALRNPAYLPSWRAAEEWKSREVRRRKAGGGRRAQAGEEAQAPPGSAAAGAQVGSGETLEAPAPAGEAGAGPVEQAAEPPSPQAQPTPSATPSARPLVPPGEAAKQAAEAAFGGMPDVAFGLPYWDRLTLQWLLAKDTGRPGAFTTVHADITLSAVAVLAPSDLHNPRRETWSDVLWNRDPSRRGKLGLSWTGKAGPAGAKVCSVRPDALRRSQRPAAVLPAGVQQVLQRAEARSRVEANEWAGLEGDQESGRRLQQASPGPASAVQAVAESTYVPPPSPSPSTSPAPTPSPSVTPSTSPGYAELQRKKQEAEARVRQRAESVLGEEAAAVGMSLEEVLEARIRLEQTRSDPELLAQWLSRYDSKGWGGVWGTGAATAEACETMSEAYGLPAPELEVSRMEMLEGTRGVRALSSPVSAPSGDENSGAAAAEEAAEDPAVAKSRKREQERQRLRAIAAD